MPAYRIDGITPVVEPGAYVHPTAVLIGDVQIGAGCYIGPVASLRGDFGRIIVMAGANVQDGCVLHGFPRADTVVETGGHIGHGAVLHGCRIGTNTMVGMNAVVMDDAQIGGDSIVAACAFVKAGFVAPPRCLIAGVPAEVRRELSDEEIDWKSHGTRLYRQLAERSLASLEQVEPLRAAEPGRRRLSVEEYRPLYKLKQGSHD